MVVFGCKRIWNFGCPYPTTRPLFVANYPKNCNWVKLGWIDPGSRLSAKKPLNNLIWRRWLPEPTIFVVLPNKYIVSNIIRISTCMESTFAIESFWDALASLGSMLESQSLSNVFEILSNPGHIFRVCSEYVQGMFRVSSGCVQSVFRVCSGLVVKIGCQDCSNSIV